MFDWVWSSPNSQLIIFGLSTLLLWRVDVSPLTRRLAAFLVDRGLAGGVSLEHEVRRIDLIRIGAGLVLTVRLLVLLWFLPHLPAVHPPIVQVVGGLVCAIFLALGFLTPLVSLVLFLFAFWYVDVPTSSASLGSFVLQMMLVVFAFLPAGQGISVDAWLRRKSPWADRVLGPLYAPFGPPSLEKADLLRFSAFLTFALVSLYAAFLHAQDIAWQSGLTNVYALTGSYTSGYYWIFRWIGETVPWALVGFSVFSTYGQLVWQFVMIPLFLAGRVGRFVVAAWVWLFAIMSAILLQLGSLPYYELLLCSLLFWRTWPTAGWKGTPRITGDANPSSHPSAHTPLFKGFLGSYAVAASMFVFMLPVWHGATTPGVLLTNPAIAFVAYGARLFGFVEVVVFNADDLTINENYATVSRVESDNTLTLLPLNAEDGARLWWHRSDQLYFGNALVWRRLRIQTRRDCYIESVDRQFINQLVHLDQMLNQQRGNFYRIDYYHQPFPSMAEVAALRFVMAPREHLCWVTINPQNGAVTRGASPS